MYASKSLGGSLGSGPCWADRNAESQVRWDLVEKLQLPGVPHVYYILENRESGLLYTAEQSNRVITYR